LTLKLLQRSAHTRRPVKIFLTGKTRPVTIAAGAKRRIAFRLSDRGAGLLRRHRVLKATLRGSMRTGAETAVVRRAKLRLVAPPR
jgi:hypothetical protein